MKNLHDEFPVLKSKTYLNTPACGLLPQSVLDWKQEQGEILLHSPQKYVGNHQNILQATKDSIGQWFGILVDEIALIPNFSFGLNMVLDSLSNEEKVLLLENDYPSVNWPVEQRDFTYFYGKIDENLELNIEKSIHQEKPTVVLFSIVQWLNGIKINLDFIKRMKKEHPDILFIADGTQYVGMETFDFSTSGIDILITSGYKWLNAGFGNGFLAIKKETRSRLHPLTIGFNSSVDFSSKPDTHHFMNVFEPGHQDILSMGSLKKAIECVDEIGRAETVAKTKELAQLAKEEFTQRGWLEEAVVERENHSPIFNLKGDEQKAQLLADNGIVSSLRGPGIRIGFHYYNTKHDLAKLIELFS